MKKVLVIGRTVFVSRYIGSILIIMGKDMRRKVI